MSTDSLPWRRLAVCASGLLYWAGVWVQARRVRRQIGRSPNLRPRGPREKALWFGWFVVIVVWLGQPWVAGGASAPAALAFLPPLLHPATLPPGLALLVLGYAGTLWCYAAMGDTWRIGINAKEKNTLVRRGPYRWVRHPIYLFQVVMLAGAALLLPTPLSFAILAAHYGCVLIKAGDEEKYLLTVHGEAYRNYRAVTGGVFPRFPWRRPAAGTGAERD